MNLRKTLLILSGIFLLALLLAAGAGLYYYTHPSKVKTLMEKAVSRATGVTFSLEQLEYSLSPIQIRARGLLFQPIGEGNGFYGKIENFLADCALKGPFGRKTLVFKFLKINGFKCRVREGTSPVLKGSTGEGNSFLNLVAKGFVSFFLFKDFQIESAEMKDGVLRTPQATVDHIQARTTIHYDHRGQRMAFPNFHLTLETARLKDLPQTEREPLDIRLKAKGDIDLKHQQAQVHGLSLNIKHLLELDGNLTAKFGPQPHFRVMIGKGRVFSQELLSLLSLGENAKTVHVSGPLDCSGTLSGRVKEAQWLFDCDIEGDLKNTPVSYRAHEIRLDGLMTAHVAVRGPLSHPELSGKLSGNQVLFEGKNFSAGAAEGTLNFSGTYPHFDIIGLSSRIPEMTSLTEKRTFSVMNVEIHSQKGHVNVAEKSLNFPEIRLKSSLLTNIFAALKTDDGRLTLTAKGKETGLIQAASHLRLLPPLWTFQGVDTVEFKATMDHKSKPSFSAKIALEKFQFQNPQQTKVGQNITFDANISGEFSPVPETTLKAAATVSAKRGEVLMDRFYFDLEENAFSAQFSGRYEGKNQHVVLDQSSLAMKNIATAHITGTLYGRENEWGGELSLRIPEIPLKGLFHRLIQEPFQTEKPALSALNPGGVIGAELTLKGNQSRWMTTGVCTWKNGSLLYRNSKVALTGIQLSLPLWLTNVTGDKATARKLEGGLSIASMGLPFLATQGMNIPIQAAPNALLMPHATTLAVPGGTVRVGPSKITGLAETSPKFQTALQFENLQLAPILSGIWPHAVTGVAAGNLDPIHIEGGQLQSKGEIWAKLFDGELTLSHVGARDLFSELPVYRLNARWHYLNLAEMTEGTSFGKIEGVLNGYANEVEVSNNQLQRFDLLLETVKTNDVPQKISVKAVDNIARLGGGQSPFSGVAGMFVSLFKEFPYQKIGVHATLENDVFKINGTIQEEDKEYLVKRGFFSGVDVINQSKDNRVGFKDMLKRINRITSSKGGPVVR